MRRLRLADIDRLRWTPGVSALLFITDRCPVGCAHCSVDSRPTSATISDYQLFDAILDALCEDPKPRLIGISGGEPFVERRGLIRAVERITGTHKDAVVYTSGVWAQNSIPSWIRGVIRQVPAAFLSTDAFHGARIEDGRFVRAARVFANEGIWIIVQVLKVQHMVEQAERLLIQAFGSDWPEHAEFSLVPPLPYGRAATLFARTRLTLGATFGPCRLLAAPVIRYDGLISACCNENVIMGGGPARLRRRCTTSNEVKAAMSAFRGDSLLNAIGSVGPGPLTTLPRFSDLAAEPFSSICEICWRMLERAEGADVVTHSSTGKPNVDYSSQ
jgi:pyruvate-formate lyase-activating enzyme